MVEQLREQIRRKFVERLETSEVLLSYNSEPMVPLSDELLSSILRTGIVIAGGPGTGKSNAGKVLATQLMARPDIQVKITDSCQNWIHEFEPIWYQSINEYTKIPEDIYYGEGHILYDLEFTDYEMISDIVGSLISTDYALQREFKKSEVMSNWIVWVIEEAQNIIGRYALEGKRGKRWLTLISEGRNFNLRQIFIGQRLADISAKAVERCQGFLFGKMVGENDIKKIKGMAGAKDAGLHEAIPELEIGEFIYWDGENPTLLFVPKYITNTKPRPWTGGMGI